MSRYIMLATAYRALVACGKETMTPLKDVRDANKSQVQCDRLARMVEEFISKPESKTQNDEPDSDSLSRGKSARPPTRSM